MRKTFIAAAVAVSALALPASAATIVSTSGPTAFAAPAGGLTIDFDSAVVAPFSATFNGAALVQGDLANQYAEPAGSNGSQYAAVFGGGNLTLSSALALSSVSFFVGSIDAGNLVELLDASGAVLASFDGNTFSVDADGDQNSNLTNRRVTITVAANEASFSGVRFSSALNSFELDNVVFAVPESSTWALMLVGFGMVGAATRYRRRKSSVSFA